MFGFLRQLPYNAYDAIAESCGRGNGRWVNEVRSQVARDIKTANGIRRAGEMIGIPASQNEMYLYMGGSALVTLGVVAQVLIAAWFMKFAGVDVSVRR